MTRVRFSGPALRTFELFFLPWMRRRVRVCIAGLPESLPRGIPLLLVANHTSWWDAFLLREVQRILRPGVPILTVMLEKELRRWPHFRYLGGVGLEPNSAASIRRMIRALAAAAARDPDCVVLYFPQGRIWPSHRRPLGFRRGVELVARALAPVVVLPVGIHIEPLGSPRPSAFTYGGDPRSVEQEPSTADALEAAVQETLDEVIAFLHARGEDALDAWPGPHGRLPGFPVPPTARGA
jgi:1-acyl-sn-glycerol-3-phosphate acyltransferase